MKTTTLSTLALAIGVSAVVLPRDTCRFQLIASGGGSGTFGQLSDGQNRVGGSNPAGSYAISDGAVTDDEGRGCILTPPTTQFQCDAGASPTSGFSVDCHGSFTYNGSPTFYACLATDTEYNIYTVPAPNQPKCVQITLSASSCSASCPTPPPPSSGCPADLTSEYQYPHLIIPISASQPDIAAGSSYFGIVNSDTSSIFNFDIPTSYTGDCVLEFLFPLQSQLQTSSYTFSGDGVLSFALLHATATQGTTYHNVGDVKEHLGSFTATPGSATTISKRKCPAGEALSVLVSATSGTDLHFFQDYNPSPIGLYVTAN